MSANDGTDCSGLVSAAAYLAGYSWATQKYGTSGLETVSREITFNELKPGDIINKKPQFNGDYGHVYVVVNVAINDTGRVEIDIIDAYGNNISAVRHLRNKDINDNMFKGYKPRRLCKIKGCK
jgi:surface antigen